MIDNGRKRIIPNEVLLPEVARLISEGHTVTLTVRGNSMNPFLVDRRDRIVLGPFTDNDLQLNTVVLARDTNGRIAVSYTHLPMNQVAGRGIANNPVGPTGSPDHMKGAIGCLADTRITHQFSFPHGRGQVRLATIQGSPVQTIITISQMQSVSAVIDEIGKKVSRSIGISGHQGAETQSQPDKYSFHGLFKINDFIAYKDIASPEHTETEKTGEMNRNL